jgi:hypothetical protein
VASHRTVIPTSLTFIYQFDTKQYLRESKIEGVRYL